MKIDKVINNVIDPPSMPKVIHLSAEKIDTLQHQAEDGNINKFLQIFTEDNQKAIKNLFEHINEFAKSNQINLKFIPAEEAGLVIIKVYDGEGNLIRQIPPEEVLALAAELEKKKGFLLNVKM